MGLLQHSNCYRSIFQGIRRVDVLAVTCALENGAVFLTVDGTFHIALYAFICFKCYFILGSRLELNTFYWTIIEYLSLSTLNLLFAVILRLSLKQRNQSSILLISALVYVKKAPKNLCLLIAGFHANFIKRESIIYLLSCVCAVSSALFSLVLTELFLLE